MATISTINIGNVVNDGLGDDLRTAFQKVNANFTALNSSLTITASNLGDVGETVFKQKNGNNLEFKRLISGNKITLTSSAESITIASEVGNSFKRIDTNFSYVDAETNEFITIEGGTNVTVSAYNQTGVITIDTKENLDVLLHNFDFGFYNGITNNVLQLAVAAQNVDFGTFTNPSALNVDLGEFGSSA